MRRRGLEPPPGYPGPGPQPGNAGVISVLWVQNVQSVHESGRNGRNGRTGCCHGCCDGKRERSWLPERAATEVAGLSCGASGQAVTSRRVIRRAPIRSGRTIQMASEVAACAHWVALMTYSVIWPRARALSTHGATPENMGSETTAIHAVGSAKRRTMAGAALSRIAPNATPLTIPVVR